MGAAVAVAGPSPAERVKDAVLAAGGLRVLAERWGVRVKGNNAHCPNGEAHNRGDQDPSMSFTPDGGGFVCRGCSERGDAFNLWMLLNGGTFKDALAAVAAEVGVELEQGRRSPRVRRRRGRLQAVRKAPSVPREAPHPPPLSAAAAELSGALWRAVEGLEPTPNMRRWIATRSPAATGPLRPELSMLAVAHELGWRDWTPARDEVVRALFGSTTEALAELGFLRPEEPEPKRWGPLEDLWRQRGRPGAFVPVFMPGLAVPYRYRWRAFDHDLPDLRDEGLWRWWVRVQGKEPPKVKSAFGTPPPFGLALPPNAGPGLLAPAAGAELVVVVEGEPDWLTVCDVLGPLAGVLCLTSLSSGWPSWATRYVAGARAVVSLVHDRHGQAIYDGLVDALWTARSTAQLHRLVVPEDDDWNARHQRGEARRRLYGMTPEGEREGALRGLVPEVHALDFGFEVEDGQCGSR